MIQFLFNVNYRTAFGEDVVLNLKGVRYRMTTLNGELWSVTVSMKDVKVGDLLDYYYSVELDGVETRHEWLTQAHRLNISAGKAEHYVVYDRWISIPEDSYLYSSAFTDCINGQKPVIADTSDYDRTVTLKVRAPQLLRGQRLAVVGSCEALGAWDVGRAIPMIQQNYNEWIVDLRAETLRTEGRVQRDDGRDVRVTKQTSATEFKFIAISDRKGVQPLWETGQNRTIELPEIFKGETYVYELEQSFYDLWNRKVAGTLVPVFSLRSRQSFGVGDFGDLKKMIDFVAQTDQRVLQVLPINDTTITHTWTDSYPYSCISIFAIHPQYVDLTSLPEIADEVEKNRFEALRQELNALPQIDYERVNNAKTEYLKVVFAQEGKKMMATPEYKQFFKDEEMWLVPYAQYSFLRDENGTADFSQWKGHEQWNEADRKTLTNPRTKAYKQVEFYYFVQFVLSKQMADAHAYARSKGVVLKGDIPIGVNRYGCDVWMEPKYFNLNGQAGAPPDDFSVNGQNWGFPTYNWDAMIEDGCQWWVRRFQNMSKYFDAYRIDHVLGFFRIWEIPIDAVHGLLGQFSPSLGMTVEEIEAYGLRFQEEQFTRPFIADWVLDRMFGDRAQMVKDTFLRHEHDDIWALKPEYDTQRKIEAAFENIEDNSNLTPLSSLLTPQDLSNLRDGLYALVSDVLFVRDRKDKNKFHPRISVQFDFVYEALYDNDKAAFNRLYNDYFYRRNNQFWYREAMKKLPKLVQATRMLVCAEDLGMVPDCVAWVMNELRILSLELQSMPKDPKVRFGILSANPYRSVCTISSHDMPTLRQWWDEDFDRTQAYYNTALYRGGEAPHPLPGWLARDIIAAHLACPSMLCVLSIQDWLAIDEALRLTDQNAERINIPANPKHYWRYRMHLNIEDLLLNKEFVANIKELLSNAGRV